MMPGDKDGLKILLVGNFRQDAQESMLRFEGMLAQGLAGRGHQVSRIFPAPWLSKLARPYRYAGWPKLAGYFDKFILFPRRLRKTIRTESPDVIHIIDHANAVYAGCAAGTPLVVTCHDLMQIQLAGRLIPGPAPGFFGRRYQHWILRHLRRAPFVVCVSEKTKSDFQELAKRTDASVTVIYNGLNHPFRRREPAEAKHVLAAVCERRGIPLSVLDRFVFNLSGGQWYKNRPGLLAIHQRLRQLLPDPPALLLGGKDTTDSPLPPAVHATGPLSPAELEAAYSLADALIHPAWAEGFGWPVAEAQACGCPVFTSNRAPLTEVGGEAAVYFDPTDPAAAAHGIATAWDQRERMRQRGLVRAEAWNPARMLLRYEQVYRAHQSRQAAAQS